MKEIKKDEIITFNEILEPFGGQILDASKELIEEKLLEQEQRQDLNDLIERIKKLDENGYGEISKIQLLEIPEITNINLTIDSLMRERYKELKCSRFSKLTTTDIIVSSVAGLIAVAIDVMLVGTPEVVKIYRAGERFDGSVLTKAIRKMSEGPIAGFAEKLSKICKVPYDISIVKDGMIPNNHRLRSLSHDPFFGLFFAIFDIVCNTTTFIDNAGYLRIILSPINNKTLTEKILAVFFYIGHIVSDLFTSRGIPVPGFFLTQFFTTGGSDSSIAKIAENMYNDGYDMRHLASMNAPVLAKSIILSAYLQLSEKKPIFITEPVAIKEKQTLLTALKKEEMNLIADSIAVCGNTVKFFAPPYSCNPCSLNVAEWFSFLRSSINMARAAMRDLSVEQVLDNRKEIDRIWDRLLAQEE